ncbi:DUF2271 domain-containing protein [Thermus sp.]|uniref:DUF2271 domain-containing protein n=1 Tax=Thermus sp. TaxID=275 RepID=UPI0025EE7924|nr:DUF2271 domain-containing protein [Thermus sp.]MCS6869075.1 DUF2271 domain-containing protein [Thermus sp.]
MLRRYYSRRSFFRRVLGGVLALGLVRAQGKPWPPGMELRVSFAYGGGGLRYRAPYLAVYVEDERGHLVRTLALFLMPGKGERWWNELRRYFSLGSLEAMRTLSGPTRPPGRYTVAWDGKDERGQAVAQGNYYLCVEYAREHGPYELFREKVELGEKAFQKSYSLRGELVEVALDYGKKT